MPARSAPPRRGFGAVLRLWDTAGIDVEAPPRDELVQVLRAVEIGTAMRSGTSAGSIETKGRHRRSIDYRGRRLKVACFSTKNEDWVDLDGFTPLERLYTVGPFEDWLASPPEGSEGPALVVLRHGSVTAENLDDALKRGARRAQAVEHHLVRHCFGAVIRENGQTAQLLEAFGGTSLFALESMRAGLDIRFELRLAVWLVRQVLEALDHAHSQDVTHDCLAPDLVFLTKAGGVKVDFGVIDAAGPRDERYRRNGSANDVYACAVVLFELLTGLRFTKDHAPLRTLVPAAPQSLERRLSTALGETDRPIPDARTFELDLTQLFYADLDADDERDGQAALTRWVERAVPTQADVVARFLPTNPGDPSVPLKLPGRFTMALSERDQPVRPKDLATDDYELPSEAEVASTWVPGIELRAKLDRHRAAAMGPTDAKDALSDPAATFVDVPDEELTEVPGVETPVFDPTAVMPPPSVSMVVPHSAFDGRLVWFLIGFTLTLGLLIGQRWIRERTTVTTPTVTVTAPSSE